VCKTGGQMQKSRFFLFFYLFLLLFFITSQQKNSRLYAQDKERIDSLFKLAELYFNDNNFDSTKICYQNVLDIDQKNVKALLGLAKNEYQQSDLLDILSNKNFYFAKSQEKTKTGNPTAKFNNAFGYIEKALQIDPDNIETNYLAGILCREKMRLRFSISRESTYENGLKYFQKVLALNKEYKDIYVQHALLFRF
jgi:tetratricopeptide (TPR) repeat protein